MNRNLPVFSKDWFEAHQKGLLTLANNRVGRAILGVPHDNRIVKLTPNGSVWEKGDKNVLECFSGEIYAKNLYKRLYPLWRTAHAWDSLVNSLRVPELNLGFDTLICYPEVGGGGANVSVDGNVNETSNDIWATIRADGGLIASASDTLIGIQLGATSTENVWDVLTRGVTTFDTSPLSGIIPDSATLSLYPVAKATSLGTVELTLVTVNLTNNNNLVPADYNITRYGVTELIDTRWSSANWGVGYKTIALNGDGISAISTNGVTPFGYLLGWDFDNSPPTWLSNKEGYLRFLSADNGSNAPKLTIEYKSAGGRRSVGGGAAYSATTNAQY